MRKRVLSVVVLSCLLLAACTAPGGAVSAPPSGPPAAHDPKNARQTETLDLGRVRLYPRAGLQNLNSDREKQILGLMAKKLKEDRNISIQPEIFYVSSAANPDPDDAMRAALESGDGPEIVLWESHKKADPTASQWMPLALDDAIAKYGPNLRSGNDPGAASGGLIPEDCWSQCKVGNATVAIPCWSNKRAGLVANQAELDKLGAKVPTTIDDLEALMAKAKEQGIQAISAGIETELPGWYGIDDPLRLRRTNSGLHSVYALPEYTDFLTRLLSWQKNGWFTCRSWVPSFYGDNMIDIKLMANPDAPWLFRSTHNFPENRAPYVQKYFKGAVAVPPIDLSGGNMGSTSSYQVEYLFQSYNKPEALVSLLDWALSDGANENLLHWGVEGEDYSVNPDGTRRTLLMQGAAADALNYHSFSTLALAFGFTGLFGLDQEDGMPQEYSKAFEDLEQYARDTARPSDVPCLSNFMITLYARPGSQLEAAYGAMKTYVQSMENAGLDVLNGKITVQDFQQAAIDGEKDIQGYVKLIQGMQAGTYDPATDMYQPASH